MIQYDLVPGTLCYATLIEFTGSNPRVALNRYPEGDPSNIEHDFYLYRNTTFMIVSSVNMTQREEHVKYFVITEGGGIGWTMWHPKNFKIIQ